jgi:hypothetical protein
MFYKNWPYWLRGGILGIILEVIYYVVLPYLTPVNNFWLYFSDMNGNFHPGYLLPPTLLFLFAGIVIGAIYGKIKNK